LREISKLIDTGVLRPVVREVLPIEAANGKKFPNASKPLIKTPDGFVFLDPANSRQTSPPRNTRFDSIGGPKASSRSIQWRSTKL
jgi:hypothetical protein